MSNTCRTAKAGEQTFEWTAPCAVYNLSSSATAGNLYDQLTARLDQLGAMLTIVSGEGTDCFRRYSGLIQSNYLWACEMLADECADLVRAMWVLDSGQRGAQG